MEALEKEQKKAPENPGLLALRGNADFLLVNRWVMSVNMTIQTPWEFCQHFWIMGLGVTHGAVRNLSMALMTIGTGNT